jgi:hypothetical protein
MIAEQRETVEATEAQHPAMVADEETVCKLPGPTRPLIELDPSSASGRERAFAAIQIDSSFSIGSSEESSRLQRRAAPKPPTTQRIDVTLVVRVRSLPCSQVYLQSEVGQGLRTSSQVGVRFT